MYPIEKIPNHVILNNVLEKNNLQLEGAIGYESSIDDCYTLYIRSDQVSKTFPVSIPFERFVDNDAPFIAHSILEQLKQAISKSNI